MILLIGDYSSVHYELSKALKSKGRHVVLISDGDAYKKIKCDIQAPLLKTYKNKLIRRLISLYRFSGLFGVRNYFLIKKEIAQFSNIEVVQIINPIIISSLGALGNILLIRYLRGKAKVISLCALGDDYKWQKACVTTKYKYSAMDRIDLCNIKNISKNLHTLKYIYSPLYRYLDAFARKKADVIIPGLLDYKLAHEGTEKVAQMINLPVSESNFAEPTKTMYPIKVFHAWQAGKERRKGNDVFDEMVQRYIKENGDSKVSYEIVSGLSYSEYLAKYKNSDIILDQVYSYDCGVTGALGMAAGKVVFSGFEKGDFEIGINATPNEEELYKKFLIVIDSLTLIDQIKSNAYRYAKANYEASLVADRYLEVWGGTYKEFDHDVQGI